MGKIQRPLKRDVNVFFLPLFLKKKRFFLQILVQAGILIVLCNFLASDSNPISNGSLYSKSKCLLKQF